MPTIDYPAGVVYTIDTIIAADNEITTPSVDVTPANNNTSVTLTNNGTIRIGSAMAPESLGVNLGSPYLWYAGLVNNGLITSTGAGGGSKEVYGVITHGAAPVINNGTLESHSMGTGRAIGIYSYYHGGTMTNAGRIEVTSDQGEAFGIWNAGLNETITNSGQLIVHGGLSPWGDPLGVIGIRSGQSTGVTINNSGTIDVTSASPNQQTVGIELFPDSSNIHSFGTVINSGTISAQLAIAALGGYSISLFVTNSGHITGALDFDSGDNVITNTTGATWAGTLTLGYNEDVVTNAGTITGDIALGKGDDVFEGRGGTVSGTVGGGEGLDFLQGGGAADRLDGGADRDVLIGGGGADQLTGGAGADSFGYLSFADSTAAQRDTITDFQSGSDTIDLRALGDVAVSISSAGGISTVTAQGAGGTLVIDVTGAVTAGDILTGTPGHDVNGTDGVDILWNAAVGATLNGLGGDDMLIGSTGNDVLDGGTGADTMEGGGGNDVYYIDNDGDRPNELDGGGIDEVRSTIDYSLQRFIENGTLLGDQAIGMRGNALDNVLTGNSGANLLIGADGNDVLIGGLGADHLDGGNGIDWASYEDSAGAVSVALGQVGHGNSAEGDTLVGIENLRGSAGDDTLKGDTGSNVLDGGAGADAMTGGAGDDGYYVDQQGDVIFESYGGGYDTVYASASYYLYDNVEKLVLLPQAGDAYGVGTSLPDSLVGNDGNNLLLGGGGGDLIRGGGGVDVLYGQDGDDVMAGDAGNDVVVGGDGNDQIDGNDGGDSLYGEDGDDILWGGTDFVYDLLVGGAGNDALHGDSGQGDFDYLVGNGGDDFYYVDTPADLTFENAGEGNDTVYASITGTGYYLYANVENLVLVGSTPYGVGNELDNHLTGSNTANWLLGGAGNDVLNGKEGDDVLFGQDGADTFVFEEHTGGDTVADFTPGTDKIDLSALPFFTSFAAVQAHMVENGGTTAINLGGGDFIVLQGVGSAALHSGDFILWAGIPDTTQGNQPRYAEGLAHDGALIHELDMPPVAIDIGALHHLA